jgi:hypothetical protein
MPEAPSGYAWHADQSVGSAHADELSGGKHSRALMRSGFDVVRVTRNDDIIADHTASLGQRAGDARRRHGRARPGEDPIGSLTGGLSRTWAFWGQHPNMVGRPIHD